MKPLTSLTHVMDTSRNINEFGLSSSKDTLLGIYITLDPPLQPQEIPIHEDVCELLINVNVNLLTDAKPRRNTNYQTRCSMEAESSKYYEILQEI
jgi:hypothetical protein